MRRPTRHRAVLLLAMLAFCVAGCCRPTVIHLGSPHDHYDHNRSRLIVSPAIRDGKPTPVREEAYRPQGLEPAFPSATYESAAPVADGLKAAHLAPTFTGVPLPLSDQPVPNGSSDRRDLIEYLAEGIAAQAGVTGGDALTQDLLGPTETTYGPMLELLASDSIGEREQLLEWVANHDAKWTDRILDSRYRARAFADRIAINFGDYWFILFQLPDQDTFTRLVVVPTGISKNDQIIKQPVGN